MEQDTHLDRAVAQVRAVLRSEIGAPHVRAFFDEPTFTASYVVHDPATGKAAIIDSVLDFDQASGRTGCDFARSFDSPNPHGDRAGAELAADQCPRAVAVPRVAVLPGLEGRKGPL